MTDERENVTDISDKGKKKHKKNLKLLIIVLIIGYFIFRAFPIFFKSYADTTTVEKDTHIDKIETKAMLIKQEIIYSESLNGLNLKIEEGNRVRRGETIGELTDQSIAGERDNKREEIDTKVSKYRTAYVEYDGIIAETLEKTREAYLESIEGLFTPEEIDSISSDLDSKTRESKSLFQDKVDELERQKSSTSKIKGNTIVAEFPGVVSYRVDGLESFYNIDEIEEFNLEDYNNLETKLEEKSDLESEDEGLKLVENNLAYMVLKLDSDYKKEIESKETIEVEFLDLSQSFKPSVYKVIEYEDEILIILKFTEGIHNIHDQRNPDIAITKGIYTGLKVPTSSITEESGQKGVYIKDISGIVRFIPIRLLYRGEDYSIVNEEEGDTIEVVSNGEKLDKRALKVFDEIFESTMFIKEGQILD